MTTFVVVLILITKHVMVKLVCAKCGSLFAFEACRIGRASSSMALMNLNCPLDLIFVDSILSQSLVFDVARCYSALPSVS